MVEVLPMHTFLGVGGGGCEGKDLEEELPMYILEGFPCI